MSDPRTEAQDLAARASLAMRQGSADRARKLYARAARAEAAALASVPPEKVKTRSILAVSVASLLYKAGELTEAERVIFGFLSGVSLSDNAESQLRELLAVVSDESMLRTKFGRRYSGETISVAMRGGEIGVGTGPLDLILEKASAIRGLLYRMAEWVGGYPLRHTGAPTRDIEDLVQARAAEPLHGSYVFEIRLTEPEQRDLFEAMRVQPIALSDQLFGFLESLTDGVPEDLEKAVPDTGYRKVLLQLTRHMAPEGKRMKEIALSRRNEGGLRSVYLTDDTRPRIRRAMPKSEPVPPDEAIMYRGILRGVHLDEHWLELRLDDGTHHQCGTVHDLFDDVLGPMVNKRVVVTGRVVAGRKAIVNEIELAEEDDVD